jgi:hypothetical protein
VRNSQLFYNSIESCEWLKYKSFSPGGYAMDNGALYTLYCCLNNMKPENILEFGLGESSKLVHQYAAYNNTHAITIEHDREWNDFFIRGIPSAFRINVRIHDLISVKFNEIVTLTYDNLEYFKNRKYDLIIVDGPLGSKNYSRSQVIEIVKQGGLSETFCILMHDTERTGEQETFNTVCDILNNNKIDYCLAHYSEGIRQHSIICSDNQKYLTTLNR